MIKVVGKPAVRHVEMIVAMRSRGFSLIELLITLAVMAVLIAAVSPSLTDWMVNLRIRNAAVAIQEGIVQAKREASNRGGASFWLVSASATNSSVLDSSCALSSSSGSWVISIRSPVGSCDAAPSATTAPMLVASHAVGDGASGVTVAAVAADGATAATKIVFNALGEVTNADAIARVDVKAATNAASHRSLRVEIIGAGAVKLCDPALPAADPRACKN